MKKILLLLQNFGFRFTALRVLFKAGIVARGDYQESVYQILSGILLPEYQRLCASPKKSSPAPRKIVWTMWWQGDHRQDKLLDICISSIRDNLPDGYQLVILSKDNYRQYLDLPDFIVHKVEKGTITLAALSDIVRVGLLARWGGIWLDPTVLCTEGFKHLELGAFWSVKVRDGGHYVPKGRYTGYAIGGTETWIFQIIYDLILYYWSGKSTIIDYFLLDYLIRFLAEQDKTFGFLLEKLPYNNEHVLALSEAMNEPYDEKAFHSIQKDTWLFKLNRKRNYVQTVDGRKTFWGYLCDTHQPADL